MQRRNFMKAAGVTGLTAVAVEAVRAQLPTIDSAGSEHHALSAKRFLIVVKPHHKCSADHCDAMASVLKEKLKEINVDAVVVTNADVELFELKEA